MRMKDILRDYENMHSIKAIARKRKVSPQVIKRVLITAGYYTTPTISKINDLYEQGCTPEQICKEMNLSSSAVFASLPYTKGSYIVGNKSLNAERIAKCRSKKAEIKKEG